MASRATVTILTADGKSSGATHPLPKVFTSPIRPDIVQYVPTLETGDLIFQDNN
jgi:large subunit ribosomal protein L4e